ncbi:hypothetical protein FSP39_007733 [Pinctada imbricata]|uniref:Non-lysosomal glucosylceramidase n=1 Tax=Pinctada imbricata TaxID=66713 RepID=A0AA89C067_PINIB|nr:hypothetical protein FSP39_007733 [Pinctada imbricata]
MAMSSEHSPENSFTTPKEEIPGIPNYGWRVNLDYECKENCNPFVKPRWSQIPKLVGLGLRYMKVWMKHRMQGRLMFIDHLVQVDHRAMYGCPIGGVGSGTIGRGFRGEFTRFQIVPGIYDYKTVQADQFIVCIRKDGQTVYQKVLTGEKGKNLQAWEWGFPSHSATYHALYPRAWTVYDIPEHQLRLICRQVSPIIPHDYKDTSFPMATFIWSAENLGDSELDVSIVFTFKNGRGVREDGAGQCNTEAFQSMEGGAKVSGVAINQTIRDMKCSYGIAGKEEDNVKVSYKVEFDPKGTGKELWDDLAEDGNLNSETGKVSNPSVAKMALNTVMLVVMLALDLFISLFTVPLQQGRSHLASRRKDKAAAVCIQTTVPARQSKELKFALTWDMPIVHFKNRENLYARRYTRWFGTDGNSSSRMCSYALQNYTLWEKKIDDWQNPILQNQNLPAWYKSALFNELYFVSDGGTLWLDPVERLDDGKIIPKRDNTDSQLVQEYSKFAYLEGHEYRMYNTYDVHHYASFSLMLLWPKIQLSLQYDIATAIRAEDTTNITFLMDGIRGNRKTKNSVPHDVGDPEEEPWSKLNAYMIHDTHEWKDLNLKFVLQVYRDYSKTKDMNYLKDMFPIAKDVVEHALRWDVDDDGLIDNAGFADQTFDAWTMAGASAYCGGMWLAVLRMIIEMGDILKETDQMDKYREILEKGKKSYEKKLWNGKYYNFDCSTGGHHDSIMADQLAGHWFLKASDLADDSIFPPDHVKTTLQTIYDCNVKVFENGNMGAINGMRPDGSHDLTNPQSEEFWVGVTYSLAASMIQEGLIEEAFQTAWGAYHVCWEWYGLAFQTPEAYMIDKHYRSLGYMRPLAIWAMQWALEKFHPNLMKIKARNS